eukprot:scaffold81945_cov63-Phaeocystis_antarctica.AAC.3
MPAPLAIPPPASNLSRLSCVATSLHDFRVLCIDPFRCGAHSAAHELSHPATLLEQHLQPTLLPSVRLYPAGSQQGDTVGRRETVPRCSHILTGLRARMKLAQRRPGVNTPRVRWSDQ